MAEAVAKAAHRWAREEFDWYVEPNWCSERLIAAERFDIEVCDPACGSGRILDAAGAAGLITWGFDVVERADIRARHPFEIQNYLETEDSYRFENTISNPPFAIADDFVRVALRRTRRKVAMLLPTKWINSDRRSRWLEETPLRRIWLLTPRPSMPPGQMIEAGEKPGNGTTDFAFFVWLQGYDGAPEVRWLRRDDQ